MFYSDMRENEISPYRRVGFEFTIDVFTVKCYFTAPRRPQYINSTQDEVPNVKHLKIEKYTNYLLEGRSGVTKKKTVKNSYAFISYWCVCLTNILSTNKMKLLHYLIIMTWDASLNRYASASKQRINSKYNVNKQNWEFIICGLFPRSLHHHYHHQCKILEHIFGVLNP